jgi:hypothetical protein
MHNNAPAALQRSWHSHEKSCTWEAVLNNRNHVLLSVGLSPAAQTSPSQDMTMLHCTPRGFLELIVIEDFREISSTFKGMASATSECFLFNECFPQTLVCAMGSLHLDGCVDVAAQLGLRLFRRKDLVRKGAQCHRVRGRLHLERCQPIQVALLICMKLLHVVVRILHAPVLNLFLDVKHLQKRVRILYHSGL